MLGNRRFTAVRAAALRQLREIGRRRRLYGLAGLASWGVRVMRYLALRHVPGATHHVRRIHGYRLGLSLRDPGLARTLLVNGTREEQLRSVLEEEVREGMAVLDIGANVGYYTLLLCQLVGEAGHVYAVEPAPANYRDLLANIALNDAEEAVTTFQLGISDRCGLDRLYLSDRSNLCTFLPFGADGRCVTPGIGEAAVDVPVVDLPTFLMDTRPIHLIRMDVEGFEVKVLGGLVEAVDSGRFSGTIVFECHTPKYGGGEYDIRSPLRRLLDRGYRVKTLTSRDEPENAIRALGYRPSRVVVTDAVERGVYRGVSDDDALALIGRWGGVKDVVLSGAPRGELTRRPPASRGGDR